MASACVNSIGVSPESFIDCPPSAFPAYGWLSPRLSFSREYSDTEDSSKKTLSSPEVSDPVKEQGDFEFRVDDPVKMLPADELFSDGKLVPLQLTVSVPPEAISSPEGRKSCAKTVADDPSVFSPKAPRCSSRWREFLGLKKSSSSKPTSASTDTTSLPSSSSSTNTGKSSIRQFLHRTSKSMSASDATLRLPLLKESDSESISVSSSRFSLSSSSSGHDHDDFARLSLDAADLKPSRSNLALSGPNQNPRVRMVKPRMVPISVTETPKPLIDHPTAPNRPTPRSQYDPAAIPRRVSMDSPRMISSGKIVFESLERSCSSPSSLNGGPRHRNRGVERSYSANVRIAPVLNVPVCSLRGSSKSGVLGFGQLFSSQSKKKEANPGPGSSSSSTSSNGNSKLHYYHHCNSRLWKASS